MPSETKTDVRLSIFPFDIISLESPANGIGALWKQSSVSLEPIGCGKQAWLLARLQA